MSNEFKYVWNKQRGCYNVNIDKPVYNPETKKTTHRYKLVGTAKERGGEITFGPSYKLSLQQKSAAVSLPSTRTTTTLMGEHLIIDKAIRSTGVKPFLKRACSKEDTLSILDLASYILCTGDPLSSAEAWLESHGKKSISPERISELLARLDEDTVSPFLASWMDKKGRGKSLWYDISSISSYARNNQYAAWGQNRDKEKLPQINLALLSVMNSDLPIWFSPLPISMNDRKTLQEMVVRLKKLGVKPVAFSMDRGFYSQENLTFVTDQGIKFSIPVPQSVKWTHPSLQKMRLQMLEHISGYIRKDDGTIIQSQTVYAPFPTARVHGFTSTVMTSLLCTNGRYSWKPTANALMS